MDGVDIVEQNDPDIKIKGLSIWILSRDYETLKNFFNGNGLTAAVQCESRGASVFLPSVTYTTHDFVSFSNGLKEINDSLSGCVDLSSLSYECEISLKPKGSLGHIEMSVQITPDRANQEHSFIFELDQSYLNDILNQFVRVNKKYPIIYNQGKI